MRLAFLGAPYVGGVYTVYRSLRSGMERHGVELRWVAAGDHATAVMADANWAHEQSRGTAIAAGESDADTARALWEHLAGGHYDGVIVNVRMRPIEMNIARYLPADLPRLMIVHSTQPGTYGPATSLKEYVHATVGVSPKVRDELVRWRGFEAGRTHAVFHGVEPGEFPPHRDAPEAEGLRLIFLGRIDEQSKGVFRLPAVMKRLGDAPITLTVAGDGPDLAELRRRCGGLEDRVRFAGAVDRNAVPALLAEHDVMLMPSRFEGMGLTLIEAMAAGCVPIVSSLKGVTDRIVTEGVDGFLVRVGDVATMADRVRGLAADAARRRAMGEAGRRTVAERFTAKRMAELYLSVLEAARVTGLGRQPLDINRWRYPMRFSNPLRRLVPEPVRRWVLTRG